MIKHRILDPFNLILEFDSALDLEKSDYKKYLDTRDESCLVFKAGESPSRFLIRQVDDHQKIKIHGMQNLMERAHMAIRCGLLGVQDMYIITPTGETKPLEQPVKSSFGEWGEIITEDWMSKARFDTDEKIAIGGTILTISEVRVPL